MKNLVVYYSLEGNTGSVAEKIKEVTGADLLRLVPKKAYSDKGFAKFLWGGKSAIMAEKPELEKYDINPADYDRIVFGFPVWASNYTPPIRTFIEENKEALKGKRIAAFACQAGSGGEKALAKLAKSLDIDGFEQSAIFIDPKARRTDETDAKIDKFISDVFGSGSRGE